MSESNCVFVNQVGITCYLSDERRCSCSSVFRLCSSAGCSSPPCGEILLRLAQCFFSIFFVLKHGSGSKECQFLYLKKKEIAVCKFSNVHDCSYILIPGSYIY